MLNICVIGAKGRMGEAICEEINKLALDINLCGQISKETSLKEKDHLIKNSDAVIDFSLPEALPENLKIVEKYKKPTLIGVTGLCDEHKNLIKDASKVAPILYSANTSIGVVILRKVTYLIGKIIRGNDLKDNYALKITDIHHKNKKDSPSGTALSLLDEISKSLGENNKIEIESERIGDVIGEHSLILSNELETLEFSHKAKSRSLFAKGAVDLVIWLYNNHKDNPGYYTMDDVICV